MTITVFQNGQFLKSIPYQTKALAKKHYQYFNKFGMCDPNTGEVLTNTKFELI